jgi:hypothetical protein
MKKLLRPYMFYWAILSIAVGLLYLAVRDLEISGELDITFDREHSIFMRVPLSKEIETQKQYQVYKLWRDMSLPFSEEGAEEVKVRPLIAFLVPRHAQSYREYQTLSNEIVRGLQERGQAAEVYTLDFKE